MSAENVPKTAKSDKLSDFRPVSRTFWPVLPFQTIFGSEKQIVMPQNGKFRKFQNYDSSAWGALFSK